MTKGEMIEVARLTAAKHSLDPILVCALCHHESGNWNSWAMRYEPAFYTRYMEKQRLRDTEKYARAFSYGLTQIMGQTAREFGFAGNYLSELFDPATNLEFGCRKLAHCFKRAVAEAAPDITRSALFKYNGGGLKEYPDLVLKHFKEYSV